MGKWIAFLLLGFVTLAVVGALVDGAQALLGIALLAAIVIFAVQYWHHRDHTDAGLHGH